MKRMFFKFFFMVIIVPFLSILALTNCDIEDDYAKSWRFYGNLFQKFTWIEWEEDFVSEEEEVLQVLNGSKENEITVNMLTPLDTPQAIQFRTDAISDFWFEMNPGYNVSVGNGEGYYDECELFYMSETDYSSEVYETINIGDMERTMYCMTFEISEDNPEQTDQAGIIHISWNNEWTREIILIPDDFTTVLESFSTYDYNSSLIYKTEYNYLLYSNAIDIKYLDEKNRVISWDRFIFNEDDEMLLEKQNLNEEYELTGFYESEYSDYVYDYWYKYNAEDDPETDDAVSYCEFHYDSSDTFIERADYYDSDDELQYYYIFDYSSEDLLDIRSKYSSSDTLLEETEYYYNENDLLMSLFLYDTDDNVLYYTNFQYQLGIFYGDDQETIFFNENLQ